MPDEDKLEGLENEFFAFADSEGATGPDAGAPAPQPTEPAPQPQPSSEGQPRDDRGRYASTVPQEPAQPQPAQPAPQEGQEPRGGHTVPLRELLDEREKRQGFERRFSDMERQFQDRERYIRDLEAKLAPKSEPKPTPDLYADPNAFEQHVYDRAEERIAAAEKAANDRLARVNGEMSLRFARMENPALFDEAYKAAREASPDVGDAIRNADDPGRELLRWYRDHRIKAAIPDGDLDGYVKRREDDLLKDPAFLARAAQAARDLASGRLPAHPAAPGSAVPHKIDVPRSLSSIGAAGTSPGYMNGDASDQGFWDFATKT